MRFLLFTILCSLLTIFFGCGGSGHLSGLAPASGTVTFEGKPVDGATVTFIPKQGQSNVRVASATTDANGKFTLMTLQPKDGIYPGEYSITVEKTQETGEYREEGEGRTAKLIDTRMIADLLPVKYRDLETTDLSITISSKGDKNIVLELSGTADTTPKKPNARIKR